MIRMRVEKESNYWAVFNDGVTTRFVYDPNKEISKLKFPEFYDMKITNSCSGKCSWCYMDSKENDPHYPNIVQKFKDYFEPMTMNHRPFQIAFGGGNPNEHPEFCELMKVCYEMGIMPNYTTNGMGLTEDVLNATYQYCGGVAISTHEHLDRVWRKAVKEIDSAGFSFTGRRGFGLKVNLHIIVSDEESIQRMIQIYEEFKNKIDYFVLLPMIAQGRSNQKFLAEDFLFDTLRKLKDTKKFAFGAKLYPSLQRQKKLGMPLDIMLYEPEVVSKFIDMKDMKIYNSSFDMDTK